MPLSWNEIKDRALKLGANKQKALKFHGILANLLSIKL